MPPLFVSGKAVHQKTKEKEENCEIRTQNSDTIYYLRFTFKEYVNYASNE